MTKSEASSPTLAAPVATPTATTTNHLNHLAATTASATVASATSHPHAHQRTPPRHNYANEHTPIASAKRPRSSCMSQSRSTSNNSMTMTTPKRTPTTQDVTMLTSPNGQLSPLHPPKAPTMSRSTEEEEELFSPVLHPHATCASTTSHATIVEETAHVVKHQHVADHPDDEEAQEEMENANPHVLVEKSASDVSHENMHLQHHHTLMKVSDNDDLSETSLSVTEWGVDDMGDEGDFNPWQFIKSLPPYETVRHLTPAVALPPRPDNFNPHIKDDDLITLVLDLDETLVHCTVERCETYDFVFPVVFHDVEYTVYVKLRPHLQEFLKRIQDKYEVVVFTASQKVYANELLDRIDPQNQYFHHRLFRESCLAVDGNFLKDLTVLGRDLSKVVLVDNSPHAFGYQVDNGIPIESWFENPQDRELLKLERFLRQLQSKVKSSSVGASATPNNNANPQADVRTHVRSKFQCTRRVAEAPEYGTF